jgi:CheY-like chemotaxis protein
VRTYLAEAHNASLRARELVDQILTFGRQQNATEQTPLDLAVAVEEARRFLRATVPANIVIKTNITPGCSDVLADPTQMHQVLLNLGSNAAHAMRAAGGTLEFDLQPFDVGVDRGLTLAGAPAGSYVRLSVRDTGHGIDEATLGRIFDPFFTTKNIREGTGLGLAVVHGIVRTHRGTIDVESTPGKGSVFHIYLPAITQEKKAEPPAPERTPVIAGLRICVVDDENLVAQGTRMVLESKGYRVVVFSSAEECLAAFQAGSPGWDVILTDQSMLGMQGTALAAIVRQQAPTMPIIIMSGFFSKISAQTLDELGHIGLLAKPYTIEELLRSIQRATQRVTTEPA